MANITITPANVLANAGSSYLTGKLAGETLTAGQWVYLKQSDGRIYKAHASTAEKATVVGLTANGAAAGQPVSVISKSSSCAVGSVVTSGQPYFISGTEDGYGLMYPTSDFGTVIFPQLVCYAVSDSAVQFDHTDPKTLVVWLN